MFWLFYSLHECTLPHSETGICESDDSLWLGSKWGRRFEQIPAQVLAHSFDTDTSTTAYFDNNLCNKGDGKQNLDAV